MTKSPINKAVFDQHSKDLESLIELGWGDVPQEQIPADALEMKRRRPVEPPKPRLILPLPDSSEPLPAIWLQYLERKRVKMEAHQARSIAVLEVARAARRAAGAG